MWFLLLICSPLTDCIIKEPCATMKKKKKKMQYLVWEKGKENSLPVGINVLGSREIVSVGAPREIGCDLHIYTL